LPDELPFWQLTAGVLAAVFAVLGAGAFVRTKGPLVAVMVGLLLAVPFAGFMAYSIVPGRKPDLDAMLVAWIPASIALAGGVAVVASVAGRRPLTAPRLVAAGIGTVVLWEGVVVAVSIVLAQWQPAYAVANIALNAVWLAVWLPSGLRGVGGETTVEILAPKARVFEFLARPSNWPQFDEDAVSATVRPSGDLAVGTEIVQVRRYEAAIRGPRMLPDTVEVVAVVTGLVPEESIATRSAAGSATAEYAFAGTAAATALTIRGRVTVPYRAAILGAAIVLWSQRASRAAKARRNLARLKALLEQP
jgi:hypothetical protein